MCSMYSHDTAAQASHPHMSVIITMYSRFLLLSTCTPQMLTSSENVAKTVPTVSAASAVNHQTGLFCPRCRGSKAWPRRAVRRRLIMRRVLQAPAEPCNAFKIRGMTNLS